MLFKVAVIVNDMAEVNIDAELVRGEPADDKFNRHDLIELTNGCICCSLRDDLIKVGTAFVDSLPCCF